MTTGQSTQYRLANGVQSILRIFTFVEMTRIYHIDTSVAYYVGRRRCLPQGNRLLRITSCQERLHPHTFRRTPGTSRLRLSLTLRPISAAPHKCGGLGFPGYRPLSQRQITELRYTPIMPTLRRADMRSRWPAVKLARRPRNITSSFQTNHAFTPLGPFADIRIYYDASPTVSSHPFRSTLNLIIWINSIIRSPHPTVQRTCAWHHCSVTCG